MSRITATLLTGALVLGVTGRANAQVKVIPGEQHTVSAVVEAIEQSSRTVVVRMTDGTLRSLQAGPQAQLAAVKIGDTVNATYYENIVIRKKAAGEPDVDTLEGGANRGSGPAGGTIALQQTITATITAVDMNAPSISLKGPRNWSYSSKVQDKKALEQVKVGDKVDITWTEAFLIGIAPAKK